MMLTDKQKEFIKNANKIWNFKIGATRSGKTYLDFLYRIPSKTRDLKGKDGIFVIMGVSQSTVERNVLEPMRNIYGDNMVGFIQQNKSTVKLFGETFHVVGHEKANAINRIQGASIKYCYIDEIVRMSEPTFEMLKSRLDQDYSCCDATGNPEQPTHFVKKFIDEQINEGDLFYQHYTLNDNPNLPTKFVDRLKREYKGTVYYDRYILGQWTLAEGVIYHMFNKENHVSKYDGQSLYNIGIGVDYGSTNATTFNAFGIDRATKKLVGIAGYKHSGKSESSKSPSQYALDMVEFVKKVEKVTKDKVKFIVIDPSAKGFADEVKLKLNKAGFNITIRKANNEVKEGIIRVQVLLFHNMITFDPSQKGAIEEFGLYSYDPKSIERGDEKPIKDNDHDMDGIRYLVMEQYNILKPYIRTEKS